MAPSTHTRTHARAHLASLAPLSVQDGAGSSPAVLSEAVEGGEARGAREEPPGDGGPVPKPETRSSPGSITCRKRGGPGAAAALNKAAGLRFDPLSLVPGKC